MNASIKILQNWVTFLIAVKTIKNLTLSFIRYFIEIWRFCLEKEQHLDYLDYYIELQLSQKCIHWLELN